MRFSLGVSQILLVKPTCEVLVVGGKMGKHGEWNLSPKSSGMGCRGRLLQGCGLSVGSVTSCDWFGCFHTSKCTCVVITTCVAGRRFPRTV